MHLDPSGNITFLIFLGLISGMHVCSLVYFLCGFGQTFVLRDPSLRYITGRLWNLMFDKKSVLPLATFNYEVHAAVLKKRTKERQILLLLLLFPLAICFSSQMSFTLYYKEIK